MTVSEEQRKGYEQALVAKRKEFGIEPKGTSRPISEVLSTPPPPAQGFARPDVFAPYLIEGSRDKWNSFNTTVHPDAAKVKALIGKWYNEAASQGKSCLVEGDCGTGKSHLAQALADAFPYIRSINNRGVAYVNEVSFVETLKTSWNEPSSPRVKLDDLLVPCILIFDDLGAYQTKDPAWLYNIYYNIFEERCEKGKPTLILTNLALEKDRGFGLIQDRIGNAANPRNYDRLMGAINIFAPDPNYVKGKVIGCWHGELYMPSARTGNIYTSVVSKVKSAIERLT